jgi:hypothetical protein
MRRATISACLGLAALACFGVGCSGDKDGSVSATPTPAVSLTQSTATPISSTPAPTGTRAGPSTPGPNSTLPAGVNPQATPSEDYVPMPSPPLGAVSTVFPPVAVRDAARACWTPVLRGPSGMPSPPSGAIQGILSYPSEGLPQGLLVCAASLEFGDTYCTDRRIQIFDPARGFSVSGYELLLPPGRYHVYAEVPNFPLRAYYSLFNICGSHVACPSHDPIIVTVRSGQLLRGVDPGDWYAWPP